MLGHESKIKILGDLEVAGVDLEYFLPFLQLRKINMNLAVETPGPEESLVQNVRPVGRRKYDHTGIGVEAVHLGKQLVERVLTLIVG